jgi:hypothetical protein
MDGTLAVVGGGNNTATIAINQMGYHTHSATNMSIAAHTHDTQSYGFIDVNNAGEPNGLETGGNNYVHNVDNTNYNPTVVGAGTVAGSLAIEGDGASFSVLNPNVFMYYIIKYN